MWNTIQNLSILKAQLVANPISLRHHYCTHQSAPIVRYYERRFIIALDAGMDNLFRIRGQNHFSTSLQNVKITEKKL